MAMLVYQRVRFSNYPHLWNAQPLLHAEEQILVPETLLARFMGPEGAALLRRVGVLTLKSAQSNLRRGRGGMVWNITHDLKTSCTYSHSMITSWMNVFFQNKVQKLYPTWHSNMAMEDLSLHNVPTKIISQASTFSFCVGAWVWRSARDPRRKEASTFEDGGI